jgi:hypothetical protein
MSVTLNLFRHRFYRNDGTPNAGGKVYTYISGTSTLTATYTDSTGTTPNTNPIILDAKGEASIWQSTKIKVNVTDSNDLQITGYPVDGINYLVVGDEIHNSTNKVSPIDTDEIGIYNYVAGVLAKVTFLNLWGYIQGKLPGYLYAPSGIGLITPNMANFTTLNSTGAGGAGSLVQSTITGTILTVTGASSNTVAPSAQLKIRGGQIGFPATPVPSTDNYTLDRFAKSIQQAVTNAMTTGTTPFATTPVGNILSYTIVGDRCFFNGLLLLNNSTSPLGFMAISGMPTPLGSSWQAGSFLCLATGMGNSQKGVCVTISPANFIIARTDGTAFVAGDLPNGTSLYIAGNYQIA